MDAEAPSTKEPGAQIERPLNQMAKATLIGSACGVMVLFYGFAIASTLFLLLLVALEACLVVAALRFGATGLVVGIMNRHAAILRAFLRGFRLPKGAELQIALEPDDAPKLFAMVGSLCGRLQIRPPHVISLEMSANAWVRLKGYGRGAGKTVLGVGYDLLGGLAKPEVDAVLAHEMAHAKLIQRGFKQWLTGGFARSIRLATDLTQQVAGLRRAGRSSSLASMFLSIADRLARTSARLVATYSRQDEFAADRGAAELCGARAIRSALVKIRDLSQITARLPWRERVAQLEAGSGFSQWLVNELAVRGSQGPGATDAELFNQYSTHPLLRDRLAALPASDGDPLVESGSAIDLLAKPDQTAEKLVAEIQRVLAEQERKDGKALERLSNKTHHRVRLRPLQITGLGLIGAGVMAGIVVGAEGPGWLATIASFVLPSALGVWLFCWGRYREQLRLPIPDFSLLKDGWKGRKTTPDINAAAKAIESELRLAVGGEKRRKRRALALASASYHALGKCDYLRAHVAARLSLEASRRSIEGALGLAIAAAALGQGQQVTFALRFIHKAIGTGGLSTEWGIAWALLLIAEWVEAEAFLQQALKKHPGNDTLLILLALSQSRRGKLQSAIINARRACTPAPRNKEYTKLLIELLLDAGSLKEARRWLESLEGELRSDPALALSMVKLHLLSHNVAEADAWTRNLKLASGGAGLLVRLGEAYELAREVKSAASFYQEALAAGHYPEAHLGLARLEAARGNLPRSQEHTLAAMNLEPPLGEDAVGPLPLLQRSLRQLIVLQPQVASCKAWIARQSKPGGLPAAFGNKAVLVYAPDGPKAEAFLKVVLNAMHPGTADQPRSIGWQAASRQQQPVGPVHAGVQGIVD